MKSILISICILLSSCSLQEKQPIVYTSTWKQESDSVIMQDCKQEAVYLTLVMYEANIEQQWDKQDVMRMEHLILKKVLLLNLFIKLLKVHSFLVG